MSDRLARLNAPESVSQLTFEAIRDAIVDKELPPGGAVTEADLAEQLGVSKTPVREALLRLREIGLIEGDGRRGARVVRPSHDAIVNAFEMRWALEPALAGLTAVRATDEQRQEVRHAATRSLEAARARAVGEFRRWDRTFHAHVADAAASPGLAGLSKNALDLSAVLRARDFPRSGDSVKCAQQHVEIADAIERDDEASAHRLAAEHVEDVLRLVLKDTAQDPAVRTGAREPPLETGRLFPELGLHRAREADRASETT